MKFFKLMLLFLILFSTAKVFAGTQHITVSAPFYQMDSVLWQAVMPHIIGPTAEINNGPQGAEEIIKVLISKKDGVDMSQQDFQDTFKNKNFYCVFHILRWSNPDAAAGEQTVQDHNWYLYHQGKLTLGTATTIPRLYGVGTVTFVFIHLNREHTNDYSPGYRFEIQEKTPAYIGHLLGLLGGFGTDDDGSNEVVRIAGAARTPTNNWWGVSTMTLQYKTSDITAAAKLVRPTAVQEVGDPQKFDNEGKYLVDFSVGVPIRRFSELSFDSTNNTVSAKEVDRTNVLALVNIYVPPVDIKSNSINLIPHFVGGVAIDKQPLKKILVGTGFGPLVANFYIGALFVKQDQLSTLQPGDSATPDQLNNDIRKKYKAHVAFGLNVPVGAIIEKLKGK